MGWVRWMKRLVINYQLSGSEFHQTSHSASYDATMYQITSHKTTQHMSNK